MLKWLTNDAETARDWFDRPVAARWRDQEIALLGEILPQLTGYRCISIGAVGSLSREYVGTLRLWRADVRPGPQVDICIDARHLPWASGSVDALVLLHALELSSDPQGLIRECARVLSERGQLVCLVFNPLSPRMLTQGVRRAHLRFRPRSVPPRAARLRDWLQLMEFETTSCWHYGPGWPQIGRRWQRGRGARWLAPILWSASGYAILARRQVLRRIPPSGKRLWAARRGKGLASAPPARLSCRP